MCVTSKGVAWEVGRGACSPAPAGSPLGLRFLVCGKALGWSMALGTFPAGRCFAVWREWGPVHWGFSSSPGFTHRMPVAQPQS